MTIEVTVDGIPLTVPEGHTVAAALISAGRLAWRDTRRGGRPRGLFCGIGVCFDCLVVVNGIPDIRACRRLLEPGDVVRTQHGAELPEVRE